MSQRIKFAKYKKIRLPWQDRLEPVPEKEARMQLADGRKVAGKSSDQENFLEIRSLQDMAEFQSFGSENLASDLEDVALAQDILRLRREGAQFHGTKERIQSKVGAYGAYNFLTGELGLSQLQIVFGQSIPKVDSSDKKKFESLMAKTRLADELVMNTPEGLKKRHWQMVFAAALDNPEKTDRLELSISAAKESLIATDWPAEGADLGVLGAIFAGLEKAENRLGVGKAILGMQTSEGAKRISHHSTATNLLCLASQSDLSAEAFLLDSVQQAHKDDQAVLAQLLGEEFFPAELAQARQMVASSEAEDLIANQSLALRSILKNPEIKDLKVLAGASIKEASGNESYLSALLNYVDPERGKAIEDLVKHSDESLRADHESLLTRLASENPGANLESLLELAAAEVDEGDWDAYESVNKLYVSMLKSLPQDERAQDALRIGEAKNPKGERYLGYRTSRRAFYAAALTPNLSPADFREEVLAKVRDEDKAYARLELLKMTLPDRAKTIENLSRFMHKENMALYTELLSRAALDVERSGDTPKMIQRAVNYLDRDSGKFFQRASGLQRLGAKEASLSDPRAALIVEVADAWESDGEEHQVQTWKSQSALYAGAMDLQADNREVFEQILENSDNKDKVYIRRSLGRQLFPEISSRIEELTAYSSRKDDPSHWDYLFQAHFDSPGTRDLALLTESAVKLAEGEEAKGQATIRSLAVKRLSREIPRAARALELEMDHLGEARTKSWESTNALYKAALAPGLSEEEFLLKVLEGSDEKDYSYFLRSLGEPLLEQFQETIPDEVREKIKNGELPLGELKALFELLGKEEDSDATRTDIVIEEDLITIGNESLHVDL